MPRAIAMCVAHIAIANHTQTLNYNSGDGFSVYMLSAPETTCAQ